MTEAAIGAAAMIDEPTVGERTIREIEQFLYREARLLDERRFGEWLDLFTEDLRYSMSTRGNYYPSSSKAVAVLDPAHRPNDDRDDADALAVLDETKATLAGRVARLGTGMAWAEDPPSRTRHMITNLEIANLETANVAIANPETGSADAAAEVEIRCNFIVYKSRSDTEQDFYVGARRDRLRRVDGAWKIARRRLTLDQNVLLAKNISIFF
jgi:3-phenylpropionate/cinnamic acid dioxygenase small subunit